MLHNDCMSIEKKILKFDQLSKYLLNLEKSANKMYGVFLLFLPCN